MTKCREKLFVLLSLIFSVVSFYLFCAYFLTHTKINTIDISVYAKYFLGGSGDLRPEPFESFCYIFGIFYLPLVSFISYLILVFINKKYNKLFSFASNYEFNQIKNIVVIGVIFLWGYYIFKNAALGFECWIFKNHYNGYLFSSLAVFFTALLLFRKKIYLPKINVVFFLGILILLLTSLTQITTERQFILNGHITHHYGMILGAVNQVMHGKTILVDIVSQYGVVYPYCAALFCKIFGYTIFKLSIFFVLLIFASYLFVFLSICKKIGYDSWFSLISFIVILGISHPFSEQFILNGGHNQPYYQYWPIRIFWGTFLIWFSLKYLENENIKNYIIGLIICGISFLWNLDTGMISLVSWLVFLLFNTISMREISIKTKVIKGIGHFFAIVLTVFISVAGYSFIAYLNSGKLPIWQKLFEFQSIFYKSGFYMLPMKAIDLWNIQMFVYLVVLLSCAVSLINGKATDKERFYFFLAIYGVGIFSYYQGRSLMLTLFPTSYPALILIACLLNEISNKYSFTKNRFCVLVKSNVFRWDLIKIIPFCLIFVYGLLNFATTLPAMINSSKYILKSIADAPITSVEINFIQAAARTPNLIIFSRIDDFYHYKTNTASALPFSSLKELITVKKAEEVIEILSSKNVNQVFMEAGFDLGVGSIFKPIIDKNYQMANKTANGGMILYELK